MDPTTIVNPLLVAALTWVLVALVKKFASKRFRKVRHTLPVVALVLATGIQAGIASYDGSGLSWHIVWEGILSGSMAVAGHSQLREILKNWLPESEEDKKTDPGKPKPS